MGFVDDLDNQIRDYMDGNYDVMETNNIPSVEQVSLGKKSKKMKLCAYSIDMRKSSDLLFKHHKQTSGKIHKSFLTITAKVIRKYGGQIRSFQGDCILAFWPANYKSEICEAVKAAMVTKWFLSIKLSKYFEKYTKLDYGIGLDWSEVFIVRAGISRNTNNNDLVFIGKCVNLATGIANEAKGPCHIGISNSIYSNLDDDLTYHSNDYKKENMWREGTVFWNGEKHPCKVSSYYWKLE